MREFFGSLTCEIAEKFLLAFVERMSKGKDSEMEDAQNTLKVLIEKAQKLKIDLSKVPAIQKRKSFFQVPRKVKLCVSLLVLLIAYAKFGDLIASDKVNENSWLVLKHLIMKNFSVLNRDAKRSRQSV